MTELSALQETLASEHAAVYSFGLIGGRTSQSRTPDLFAAVSAAYAAHRARRDELTGLIRERGADPAAAAPAYRLTPEPTTPAQVRRAAQRVEAAAAQSYAALVAQSAEELREWASWALTDAAVREVGFGSPPGAFPGAGELERS